MTHLEDAAAKKVRGDGVRVGVPSPGIVVTDLLLGDDAGQPEQFEKATQILNILGDDINRVTSWIEDMPTPTS